MYRNTVPDSLSLAVSGYGIGIGCNVKYPVYGNVFKKYIFETIIEKYPWYRDLTSGKNFKQVIVYGIGTSLVSCYQSIKKITLKYLGKGELRKFSSLENIIINF